MNRLSRITSLILLLTAISATGFANIPLREALAGINPGIIEALEADGEVFVYDRKNEGLRFVPETPFTTDTILLVSQMDTNVLSEALYLIPYTEEYDGLNLEMYNMLRHVRKIEDVKYFSHRRDAVVNLFEDVYRTEEPSSRKSIPDDSVDVIPPEETLYLHMKEVNFGSAHYRMNLESTEGMLKVNLVNTSVIRKFVKVLDRENMNLQLVIIPVDEGFLIHGICALKVHNKDFIQGKLDTYSAFYRRLYALEVWIYNLLHETEKSPEFGQPFVFQNGS